MRRASSLRYWRTNLDRLLAFEDQSLRQVTLCSATVFLCLYWTHDNDGVSLKPSYNAQVFRCIQHGNNPAHTKMPEFREGYLEDPFRARTPRSSLKGDPPTSSGAAVALAVKTTPYSPRARECTLTSSSLPHVIMHLVLSS